MNDPAKHAQHKPGYYTNPSHYGKTSKSVYAHPDVPGAGARARQGMRGQAKVGAVMGEYKRGTLRSGGSGKKVTNPKQAVAIGLSEAGLAKKK